MAAAPLPAYGNFENSRLEALQLKRKAGERREEDGELTKTKRKDPNPPASPDDVQLRLLRVSNRLGLVSNGLAQS
jgi:hypothetical protein